jgi:hypothetical protein
MMLDDGIMASCDVIAAQRLGFTPEIAELQFLIAHHARIWRPTRLVLAGEISNHGLLELIDFVDNVMRNT